MKIILDTDIGTDIDDAYALAFALRHPDIEVKAVTTVHGYPVERARLVQHLLTIAGQPEIPVCAGWSLPIHPLTAQEQHAYLERQPNHTEVASGIQAQFSRGDAVRLILDTVDRHAGDIALVTIGPLTNVAAALAADPDLPRKVTGIAMMAGELNRNHLEYNVRLDPRAADMVFRIRRPHVRGHMGGQPKTRAPTRAPRHPPPERRSAVRRTRPLHGLVVAAPGEQARARALRRLATLVVARSSLVRHAPDTAACRNGESDSPRDDVRGAARR